MNTPTPSLAEALKRSLAAAVPTPSPVAADLEGMKERHQRAVTGRHPFAPDALLASARDVPPLVAAIEAVLAKHRPAAPGQEGTYCVGCTEECTNCDRYHKSPCPTVTALESALHGTQGGGG